MLDGDVLLLYSQPSRYSQRLTDSGDSEVGTLPLEVSQATMTCERCCVALFSLNVALNVSSLLLLPLGSQPAPQ